MKWQWVLCVAIAAVCWAAGDSTAQVYNTSVNLVTNGNFELGSVQSGQPVVPGWIQGPNPFERIAVGDDGSSGRQSVGFTTSVTSDQFDPSTWADWLSRPFTVVPGEKLLWRFRYKMTNNAATPEGEVLADSRGFAGVDVNGNPTTYLGTGGLVILSTTAGTWTSVEKELEVPAGATALDLRINQIFTAFTTLPWQGIFRMDDMTIHRVLNLQADFDANNTVNAADLAIWRSHFPLSSGALKADGDANGDTIVDGTDFLIWQRELGLGVTPVVSVPEPAPAVLLGIGSAAMLGIIFRAQNGRKVTPRVPS
jgi:hypothetical protein